MVPPTELRPGALQALRAAVGGAGLVRDPAQLRDWAGDRSAAQPRVPLAVCLPAEVNQVAALVDACRREGLPLTARGAGTGKAGGCVPTAGGVVCGLQRMRGIRRLDGADQTVEVLPGTVTGALRDEVSAAGWFYPPDPASLDECTIGGNVATNAGGPLCVKYGVTRDWVLGLEVVLASGAVVRTGHRSRKGVAGYDLTALLVGSEGTLGIITAAVLRLCPRPLAVRTLWVRFPTTIEACAVVPRIFAAGVLPRALELFDGRLVQMDELAGDAALLVELDGDERGAEADLQRVLDELGPHASSPRLARDSAERDALWARRRRFSDAVKQGHALHLSEDVAVPLGRLPELLRRVDEVRDHSGLAVAAYGHAGDGNLHVNLLYDDPADRPRVIEASEEIFRAALDLGGTITGEHGIGLLKRPYLGWEQGPEVLDLQRRIKAALDPDGVLNPDKVLP